MVSPSSKILDSKIVSHPSNKPMAVIIYASLESKTVGPKVPLLMCISFYS